jgi:soluble lytic murein transglycosylase-like protein
VTVHDRPEVTLATGSTAILPPKSQRETRVISPATNNPDLQDAAGRAELSPALVEAVAWRESGFRRDALSPAGAIGEMQLMPGTARGLGVDPHDSRQNYTGGATYLSGLLKRYDGDMVRALAAYNAGPKAVDRYRGVPPYKETQDYVAAILDRLSRRAASTPER